MRVDGSSNEGFSEENDTSVEEGSAEENSEELDDYEGEEGEESTELEENDYQPNNRFKVMEDEYEFPDFIMKSITSPEEEAAVRELYEKSFGLDAVKQSRDHLRSQLEAQNQTLQEYHALQTDLKRAGHFLRNGDLSGFLSEYGLTEEKVIDYLSKKQELQQNPVAYSNFLEKQQRIKSEWEYSQRLEAQQRELQGYQEQQKNYMVQQREFDLNEAMGNLSGFVESYDQRLGQGAFRQAVLDFGRTQWYANKVDVPAHEAVQHIARMAGYTGQSTPRQSAPNSRGQQTYSNQQPPVASQRRVVKTLPNFEGGSGSPVRKLPRSIADLKRLAQEMQH
jgi:hypothetical protein